MLTDEQGLAQRRAALVRANDVRCQRANARRWVAAAATREQSWARAAEVIIEARRGVHGDGPPDGFEHVRGLRVVMLLTACRGINGRDAGRPGDGITLDTILAMAGLTARTTIAYMRGRQVRMLLLILRAGSIPAARIAIDRSLDAA